MYRKLNVRASALAGGLLLLGGAAQAHIVGERIIDFQEIDLASPIVTAFHGEANMPLLGNGACAGAGVCYFEEDMIIGVVNDPVGDGEHIHRAGAAANRKISYHTDSSGIYVRAEDGHAFALHSMRLDAHLSDENPGQGADDLWEILGFSAAENPDLASGNGTDYLSRVAYQTVANGFNGVLELNEGFHDIHAFWIHYKGFPGIPTTPVDFFTTVDDIVIGPAEVSPIPVPAIGIWMLGSGFTGLAALARRRIPA